MPDAEESATLARPEGARRPIRRAKALVQEVHDRILADLMSLAIAPGSRISVDELARQLGVSQTPIREALSTIEASGLVVKTPFVGYCAAPQLDPDQFRNLFEVRLLLEPFAAGRAAERMTDGQLREFKRTCATMSSLAERETSGSYGQFANVDSEFHLAIARASGNPLVAETLQRLHTHLHIFRLRPDSAITSEAVVEHAQIIDALAARDGTAATVAMRRHIESTYERLALQDPRA